MIANSKTYFEVGVDGDGAVGPSVGGMSEGFPFRPGPGTDGGLTFGACGLAFGHWEGQQCQ